MPWKNDPLVHAVTFFLLGSFGGLCALLRSKQEITWRGVLAAAGNSGLCATCVAFLLWSRYGERNVMFLFGISGLAGLGGANFVEFVTRLVCKRLGIELPKPPSKEGS